MSFLRGGGSLGVVVDDAVRDIAESKQLGVGLWLRGVTPNFHTQTNIYPYAVNVPVACGGVTVVPGDIIIADDDGIVVIPHEESEDIARRAWMVQDNDRRQRRAFYQTLGLPYHQTVAPDAPPW